MSGFDAAGFFAARADGHWVQLGMAYRGQGDDWVELALPYAPALVGDVARGTIASGPILAMMDMAASAAVWTRAGSLVMHATLDLRVDYIRPATPGRTVIGRAECYRLTRSVAFVRGLAHDGDADDPVAHVAGTFMAMKAYR